MDRIPCTAQYTVVLLKVLYTLQVYMIIFVFTSVKPTPVWNIPNLTPVSLSKGINLM